MRNFSRKLRPPAEKETVRMQMFSRTGGWTAGLKKLKAESARFFGLFLTPAGKNEKLKT
jgi:hypothetical protein